MKPSNTVAYELDTPYLGNVIIRYIVQNIFQNRQKSFYYLCIASGIISWLLALLAMAFCVRAKQFEIEGEFGETTDAIKKAGICWLLMMACIGLWLFSMKKVLHSSKKNA